MYHQYTLRAVVLAGTCLLPLAALAQADDFGVGDAPPAKAAAPAPDYANEVTVGTRFQSRTSALFGKYNGNPNSDLSGIGSILMRDRDAWNSGGTTYFELQGNDLSADGHLIGPNSSAQLKYGEQGNWGISLFLDGIHFTQSTTFHSLNTSNGSLRIAPGSLSPNSGVTFTNTTPPNNGATAAQITAATTSLNNTYGMMNSFNSPQTVELQRNIVGVSGKWSPIENWTFSAAFQHEHKEGTKENSFVTNSTTNINYFPEPVDYDTDRYTSTAAYNTRKLQGALTYTYSKFVDNIGAFQTLNPFIFAAATGYQATLYSLPPSNDAHQLKGQFAYNITPTTRVNANFGYEAMQQSSTYQPAYLGVSSNNKYIPGSNYDALAQNLFGNLALTARPITGLDLRASYTVDDRINNGNRVSIPNVAGGMITADTTGSNHVPIANLPVSILNQTAKLEAGYRVLPSTKVSLDYTYKDSQRDYSVTDRNHENIFGGRVNTSPFQGVDAMVGYSHGVRTAAAYVTQGAWLASTYGGAVNAPNAGMYYLAARTRDEVKLNVNAGLGETVTAGLSGRAYADHYPTSVYGISNDHGYSVGPDLTYQPIKDIATHFFYTYEEVFTDMNSSTNSTLATARTDWTLANKDTIHTAGADMDWQITDDFKLKFLDNLSYGATAFDESAILLGAQGTAANANYRLTPGNLVGALPDSKTITNSVSLNGEYKLTDNITLLSGYIFARAIAKDYLYGQLAGSTSNGNNVSAYPGDGNPSYSMHVVYTSVRLKW